MHLYCNTTTAEFNYGLSKTLNSTSTLIAVLWQLHYSSVSQETPPAGLSQAGFSTQLKTAAVYLVAR